MNDDFIKGAWFAFDEVLGWINTQNEQFINKKDLYKYVMELRPRSLYAEAEWQKMQKDEKTP
jgi:hypothetical protein